MVTKSIKQLETELAKKQKEAKALESKILAEKEKNKPRSIMDKVKTMKDVIRIANPTAEEKKVIDYSGKSKRMLFAKHFLVLSLISEVLNEGWEPKMDGSDKRYYPWYAVSSGFDFNAAFCADSDADTGSASRLCLKSSELAAYAGKTFKKEYEAAIKL